eukprot:TRINITY_DN439_c2_g1_i2.p1 TRINITY_DN439_c2_g1~~TRINITY_DN439_c2_g1_i2.p1  ORF type:complete len:576 (+),score=77.79 TRINITY_DN439_c2_g1_i2:63-1790(+)
MRLLALTCLLVVVSADEFNHKYAEGDDVWVYGNKIGPFFNPLETYGYFDVLPWCRPGSLEARKPTLGEALTGDEFIKLDMKMLFKKDVENSTICTRKITASEAQIFTSAVNEHYWYQLYIDDLPTWAALGKISNKIPSIYLHQKFNLGWNGDRIIIANLTAENKVPIPVDGGSLSFTYSIHWEEVDTPFEKRFRRYLDESFFEHKIHWVSVLNSFMMVALLACTVLGVLIRTLKADFVRYAREVEEDGIEFQDESGWKQVQGEVFRVPPNHALLCAFVGTGNQLIVLCFCLIFIAIASVIYADRGGLLSYGVCSYAVTSCVAGYSSARQFVQYSAAGPSISKDWKKTMFITSILLPAMVAAVITVLNTIARLYNSQQLITFTTLLAIGALWAFVAFPLVVFGTLVGRHQKKVEVPRISQIPRYIPERSRVVHYVSIAAGGILPFGSIFIELYFIFTSFWNYKFYYVYGFMLLVYIILILVTMCLSVVYTYFLLNSEDYRWQWNTFALGASTSGYVFLYAGYFFLFKTKMSGFFMTVYYFGYMFLFCFALAVMCGTVSFVTAELFVARIYRNIKIE